MLIVAIVLHYLDLVKLQPNHKFYISYWKCCCLICSSIGNKTSLTRSYNESNFTIRLEKPPRIRGFLRVLFQLRMNVFVCIKLPISCIYAISLRSRWGGGGIWGAGGGESLVVINFMYGINYNLIVSTTANIGPNKDSTTAATIDAAATNSWV